MTARLRRRLDAMQGPAIDRAYRRLWLLCGEGITAETDHEAGDVLSWILDAELARGTPYDVLLRRLPECVARMIEQELSGPPSGPPG